jgi:hypothetical protein
MVSTSVEARTSSMAGQLAPTNEENPSMSVVTIQARSSDHHRLGEV